MVEAVNTLRLRLLLALLALPSLTFAHRLDEYLQATLVVIEPGGVRLKLNLTPGVAVADEVLAAIDRNHDGTISTNEAAAYGQSMTRDLVVRLDGQKVALKLATARTSAFTDLRTGWGIIEVEFCLVTAPLAAGAHKVAFENRHLRAISVYLLNAALPKSDFVRITAQNRNENQSTGEIEFSIHPTNSP